MADYPPSFRERILNFSKNIPAVKEKIFDGSVIGRLTECGVPALTLMCVYNTHTKELSEPMITDIVSDWYNRYSYWRRITRPSPWAPLAYKYIPQIYAWMDGRSMLSDYPDDCIGVTLAIDNHAVWPRGDVYVYRLGDRECNASALVQMYSEDMLAALEPIGCGEWAYRSSEDVCNIDVKMVSMQMLDRFFNTFNKYHGK